MTKNAPYTVDGLAWSGFDRALKRNRRGAAGVFREIGVPLSIVGKPGFREPFAKYAAFFDESARQTGDNLFALRIGAVTRPMHSGLPGYVVLNSATMRDAVLNLGRTIGVLVGGVAIELDERDKTPAIQLSILDHAVGAGRQFDDHALAYIVSMLRGYMGRRWGPEEVWFIHPEPQDADFFRLVFNCPVRFSQPQNLIHLDPLQMNHKNHAADANLLNLLLYHADEISHQLACEEDILVAIERIMVDGMARGEGSLAFVADRMGMTVRTLQRLLASRGLSFRDFRVKTRFSHAAHLLRHTARPLTEIAHLVGYSEASAFSLAFRSWAGMPPGRYRREAQSINI